MKAEERTLVREFTSGDQYVPAEVLIDPDGRWATVIVRPKHSSRTLRMHVTITSAGEL